ncbi:hypothetical protein JYE49_10795 [Aristaeella hokkaidonensis]|uniref:Uncharacterized protein n=1 Tax=Aristaeella hokkaidonensis TaxID=3046382 RepID=A0AC61N0K9_9FIRM|nr:hypothetical protein JYE49_10795 [Aristaeella hokkaidonensis]
MVISFNYTGTYRKYYDPEGKAKYCYIHGKTQNSICYLVLFLVLFYNNLTRFRNSTGVHPFSFRNSRA